MTREQSSPRENILWRYRSLLYVMDRIGVDDLMCEIDLVRQSFVEFCDGAWKEEQQNSARRLARIKLEEARRLRERESRLRWKDSVNQI
jgi:hypothetical protein